MQDVSQQKRELLREWLAANTPGNCSPLFASRAPSYQLTAEAVTLLKKPVDGGEMNLYIVCLGDPGLEAIVVYVGKAASLWRRWHDGHLRNLRAAAKGINKASYAKWVRLFESTEETIHLACVGEGGINFPPIPGFPRTVGSVEYQLISLAYDSFPEYLLNREGAAR